MLQYIVRLTKHSVVYGIGHIVSRFLGFLLMPIHTNVFLPEEYRIPTLLFASLAILNVVFSYGMDVAFLRFFILEEFQKIKHRIFSTAFWMILTTGVCFTFIMVFHPVPFSKLIFRNAEYVILIRLAAGILLADVLCLMPFLVLRAEERSIQYMVYRGLNVMVNVTLNILFIVVLHKGIESIFVANLIASVLTLIILSPIIFRWLRPNFHKDLLMELFRFGLPYIPSGLAVLIMDKIGNFVIDRMVGDEATGIFSAGCKLGTIMALIVAGFRFAWHPFFLSTSKQEDAPKIFARVLTYFLIVTGFFFLVVSFFIEEIIRIRIAGFGLIGEEYFIGTHIVPVVMLAYIGYGVYTHFVVGIYLRKKTAYLPFVTGIGALIGIISNVLLVPRFGIVGAAWAMFFAYAAMAVMLFLVNRRLYPTPYEYGRILKLVILFAVLFFTGTLRVDRFSILYRFGILVMVFPLLLLIRFFSQGERTAMRRLLKIGSQ